VASLVDTNLLVYRVDPRDRVKQERAQAIVRAGLIDGSAVLAHQCIVEFVAAVTRPRRDLAGAPLLPLAEARVRADHLATEFPVLYPTLDVLRTALRGTAMYGLTWFDAHLWAHAEVYGIEEILSEDFEHGRHYGSVRVVDPFMTANGVHELPPLYAAQPEQSVRARGRRPRSV
jgi:predicted nucleic acid-binding protein